MKWSRPSLAIIAGLMLAGVVAGVARVPAASSQAMMLRAMRLPEQPPLDPDWSTWTKLASIDVPITAQNLTYPMGGGSISSVKLQAAHYDHVLYIRAAWKDATLDGAAVNVETFSDAVAVMFPAKSAVNIPSFCMGQANAGVNIWQWRADSQAGGPDALATTLHPNAYSDGYPALLIDDPIYQPARALNNPVAMITGTPVQNLVAQAFGTITLASDQSVNGQGVWRDGEWRVVFARPFAGADPGQASFTSSTATNLAVAVWNGSQGDRGGQKTVSQFVTLALSNAVLKPSQGQDWGSIGLALLLGGGGVLIGLALIALVALGFGGREHR
jgi:hypothetical protein